VAFGFITSVKEITFVEYFILSAGSVQQLWIIQEEFSMRQKTSSSYGLVMKKYLQIQDFVAGFTFI